MVVESSDRVRGWQTGTCADSMQMMMSWWCHVWQLAEHATSRDRHARYAGVILILMFCSSHTDALLGPVAITFECPDMQHFALEACDRMMKPRKTLHFRTNSLWQSFALDPELDGWMFGWILHITHYFSWKLLNCMPENVIGCTTPVLILLTKFSPANLLFFDKNKTIAK